MKQRFNNIQYLDYLELELGFKGERSYLTGADIADSLLTYIVAGKNIKLQFHQICSHPLIAFWVKKDQISRLKEKQLLSSVMAYQDQGGTSHLVAIVEDKAGSISNRQLYDESKVTVGAQVKENHITQDIPGMGNFFERAVSLNKFLLNTIANQCSWIFSRIDLKGYPVAPKPLCISLVGEVGGHNYKSAISSDGEMLGNIYFARPESWR